MRDLDILKEISKTYAAVSLTITTGSDELSRKIEPGAPVSSDRFKALEYLAKNGIYAGVTLMPLLPFINDTQENVETLLRKAKEAGASYVLPMLGVTMRKGSRDYLYRALDTNFPGMREHYESHFGDRYECFGPGYQALNLALYKQMDVLGISPRMRFYSPVVNEQLSIF